MKNLKSYNQFIRLNESSKSLYNLIKEADSRYEKYLVLLKNVFSKYFDIDSVVPKSDYYVNGNENTKWKDYLWFNFRHTFNLMTNQDIKYVYPFAKILYQDLEFDITDNFQQERTIVKQIINLCKQQPELFTKHIQGKDLNYEQLYKIFKPFLDETKNSENEIINNTKYTQNANYDVIEVKSFEQANKIGKYSGCNGGTLCYTDTKNTWDGYTKKGLKKVYCCLTKKWKTVKPEKTEGYPKDEYGLSMIFVFITPEGDISNSNVRWNHGDGSFNNVDNMFTKKELSEIIGVNFNQVFKPFTEEELIPKGFITIKLAQKLLDSGKKPKEVFNYVGDFTNGLAMVKLNNQYNFINTDGKIISDKMFDETYPFSDGLAAVELGGKYGYIDKQGSEVIPIKYDCVYDFSDGLARVDLGGKWGCIDKQGNEVIPIKYDGVYNFSDGLAVVKLGVKWGCIDKQGSEVIPIKYDYVYNFSDGLAVVKLGGKYGYVDKKGNWYDEKPKLNEHKSILNNFGKK